MVLAMTMPNLGSHCRFKLVTPHTLWSRNIFPWKLVSSFTVIGSHTSITCGIFLKVDMTASIVSNQLSHIYWLSMILVHIIQMVMIPHWQNCAYQFSDCINASYLKKGIVIHFNIRLWNMASLNILIIIK